MTRAVGSILAEILEAIELLHHYTEGLTYADFASNVEKQDAVLRRLEIIGEAVKNTAAETRAKYPEIDWRRIAGLRDIIVHQYFGIDDELLWTIISTNVDDLEQTVRRMLELEA